MNLLQLVILFVVALVITVPVMLLFRHARQSPVFDRILWVATWGIAFVGGWLGIGYLGGNPNLGALSNLIVGELPIVPVVLGAVGGVLVLHLILWVMDHLERPVIEEEDDDVTS